MTADEGRVEFEERVQRHAERFYELLDGAVTRYLGMRPPEAAEMVGLIIAASILRERARGKLTEVGVILDADKLYAMTSQVMGTGVGELADMSQVPGGPKA